MTSEAMARVQLVAAMVAVGVPLDLLPDNRPRQPREITQRDIDRMEMAQAKRARKASKLIKEQP